MPKARNSKVDEALALYRQGLKLIEISRKLDIITIGIGAGGGCDGQVLVYQDMLGITEGNAPTNGAPPKKPSARNLKNRTLANEEGSLVTRTPPGHPVTRTPRSSASCPSISQRRHWNCCT